MRSALSRHNLTLLSAGVAAFALATAWGFELLGGYEPCQLCRYQRIPYYVGLPILAASLLIPGRWRTLAGGLLLLAAAGFLAGAGIGAYQAGAEWKLWAGPSGCSSISGIAGMTADQLLARLSSTKVVSCTEAAWRFLGLSFAGWNAAVSGAVAAALGWAALAKPNGRPTR